MKFSCKTVHEKHLFASSACVVERPYSLRDKQNRVGQSRLCSRLVFCSRPIRMINKAAVRKSVVVESSVTDGEVRRLVSVL